MKTSLLSVGLFAIASQSAFAIQLTGDSATIGSGNTVASGSASLAVGDANDAGNNSIAIGWNASAEFGSIAVGENATSWNNSIAVGYGSTNDQNGWCNAAIGSMGGTYWSDSSVTLGLGNTMGLQTGSLAAGVGNVMQFNFGKTGSGNVILGSNNNISLTNATSGTDIQSTLLLGAGNESTETQAWAIGLCNIAQTHTLTVGTYAQTVSNASLIVGTGSGAGATPRKNGLVVLKNGSVSIPSGVLQLGSESALTATSAIPVVSSHLSSNGYLKKASGNSYAVPSSFLALGNAAQATESSSLAIGDFAQATSGGAIALGGQSNASKPYATALQGGQAEGFYSLAASWGVASGDYSVGLAAGWAVADNAIAIGGYDEFASWANESDAVGSVTIGGATNCAAGEYSYAFGWNSGAFGKHSYSIGNLTRTNAYAVALGSRNLTSGNAMGFMSNTEWLENGALFELGNGNPNITVSGNPQYSNAITTLKNGQTTLTNKAWKNRASTVSPTADPSTATTDSEGEALVIEGHTRLKGKVVIEQAQGDISMGDYQ